MSQFDTMWRFVFAIIHNSQPWEIPSGATAVLNGRKPDGNVFAFSCTISDNKVTVDADVQMTAVAGQTVCELSILSDGKVVGTANFVLDVEAAPKSPDDVSSESTLPAYQEMLDAMANIPYDIHGSVEDWLDAHPEATTTVQDGSITISKLANDVIDKTLSVDGAAADSKTVGSKIGDLSTLATVKKSNLVDAINEAAKTGSSRKLNVLFLYGNESEIQTNWDNRSKAKMNFRYVFYNRNKNKQKNGWCKLSLQGNATLAYPKHNFNIQFYKDAGYKTKDKVDYMDLTDDKHPKWTIKSNYNDYSQARNVVSARLWGDIVHCRAGMSAELSSAPNHGAINGRPVILMMNDSYYGLYMFNMSKSDWMIGINEDDPAHCAVSANLATSATKWLSKGLDGWELEIPDAWQTVDIDGVPTSVQAGFLALQDFVINSTDEEFYAGLSDYLDVNSAIDYLIFSFCVCNADSMNKNQFLVTWNAGKKWAFTAYDMDQTFGAGFTSQIPYNHNLFSTHPNHLFERIIDNFYNEIMERYQTLRSSVLSYGYMARELEIFFDEIPDGEREKDKVKWPGIMYQTISDLNSMKTFVQNRLSWCDNYFERLNPEYIACTGISLNANSISFAEAGETFKLIATVTPSDCSDAIVWKTSNESVATVENGLVTAVSDGSCTITATCGDYSASATVSVDIDTSVIYRLPNDLKGETLTTQFDSGKMLFDVDKNISVVIDIASTNLSAPADSFVKLANEFRVRPLSGQCDLIFGGADAVAKDSDGNALKPKSRTPLKLVITHQLGAQTAQLYIKDSGGVVGSAEVTKKSSNNSWYGNSNLVAGSTYGSVISFNDLRVYNRVISQEEIDAFFGS